MAAAAPPAGAVREGASSAGWVFWVLALLLSGGLFSFQLGWEPLWLDETYSYAMAQHGPSQIWELAKQDVHPPLYYVLLRGAVVVFGATPEALRAISALSAIAMIGIALGPLRTLLGGAAARWFVLLTLCTPGLLAFAQETRMYMLATALSLASALYAQLTLRTSRWSHAVGFALVTLAAWYTHYFAGLVTLFCVGLSLGVALTGSASRAGVTRLLFAVAVVVVGYLPWLGSALAQVQRVSAGFWVPPPTLYLALQGAAAPVAFKFEDLDLPWQSYAALAALLAFVVVALRSSGDQHRRSVARVLAGSAALTFLFALGFSLFIQPILLPRYMMVSSGLLLTCAAVGLSVMQRRPRLVLGGAWLVLNSITIGQILTGTFNGPFREMAAHIGSYGADQLVVHGDLQTLYPAWYALPNSDHVMLFAPGAEGWEPGSGVHASSRLIRGTSLSDALATVDAAWLVDGSQFADRHFSVEDAAALPGFELEGDVVEFAPEASWVSVRLFHVVRRRQTSAQ